MGLVSTRTLILLLSFSSLVTAVNFTQCLASLKDDPNAVGGVDYRGNPTSAGEAVGLTYNACTTHCGSGSESFNWRNFSQLFASWLLPWLALISQLPFGSEYRLDDLISVYMTIGSPALAAYSLALTTLNSRFVYARASRIPHESKTAVARALISLQQIPLELTKDERLLAFIPVGDQWRREIIDRLDRRSTRSIAMASSIAWVIIAFLFTLIDSFVSLDSPDGASEGLSVGILWLWLLCIVIGWLWIPTFTYDELKSALYHANEKAADKAAKKLRQQASMAYNATRVQIRNRLPGRAPNSPIVDPVSQVPEENEKVKEESFQGFGIRAGQKNDQKTNPFINPAHHRSTVSFQVPSESQQDHDRLSVGANPSANQSVTSVPHTVGYSSHPNMDRLLIPLDRYDPLHRDELRLAPIFNYARVFRYKALVDDVFRALDEHAREKEERKRSFSAPTVTRLTQKVVFPPGALTSMFRASIFALILQCGTTAAAAIIQVFTPTVGLGCRSLSYTIYGVTAIFIMFLTITSTIIARISETRERRFTFVKTLTASIAIALRRISVLLAFINTIGLILVFFFQFSNFLDNCYCNASVIGRGMDSYILLYKQGWIATMRNSRIVGTVLAISSTSIYMFFLWLVSPSSAESDYL